MQYYKIEFLKNCCLNSHFSNSFYSFCHISFCFSMVISMPQSICKFDMHCIQNLPFKIGFLSIFIKNENKMYSSNQDHAFIFITQYICTCTSSILSPFLSVSFSLFITISLAQSNFSHSFLLQIIYVSK